MGPIVEYNARTSFPVIKSGPNYVMAMDSEGLIGDSSFELLVLDKKHLILKDFRLWTNNDNMQSTGFANCKRE